MIKLILQAISIIGIIFGILGAVKSNSTKFKIISLLFALFASIGLFIISLLSKTAITAINCEVSLYLKWDKCPGPWSRSFSDGQSIIEFYKNDISIVKLRSINCNSSSYGDNFDLAYFTNDYSISSRGSFVNSNLEDLYKADSIIIFDPRFRVPIEIIKGRIDFKINSSGYYRINLPSQHFESQKIILSGINLKNYKIKPQDG